LHNHSKVEAAYTNATFIILVGLVFVASKRQNPSEHQDTKLSPQQPLSSGPQ